MVDNARMTADATPPGPPDLSGYTWRAARSADMPAIRQLCVACGWADDDAVERIVAGPAAAADALCAANAAGQLAAFGAVALGDAGAAEARAYLHGAVHPAHRRRGVGRFILRWSEARARELLAARSDERPAVLRIDFAGDRADAVPLYERHGFRLGFVEEELRRDLRRPLPDRPLPAGLTLVGWAEGRAGRFHAVYRDAFRERPGFPDWDREAWTAAFAGGATFRPDLSLLALDGDEGAGFVVCHVDAGAGWIAQIGVRPRWRGRGLASALLCAVMRGFRAEGLDVAMLEVNANNPGARGVYERLGFAVVGRRASYQKRVGLEE
jgi:mycothiol synthase